MLNKLLIGAALALLAACASTPPSPEAAKSTVAKTQQPPGCAGGNSAIPASQTANPQPCAGFGSVYTKDDITRTGSNNLGDALRSLDPSLSVSRP
jgi:hypothetical protein